nr:protein ecdysoneless homolog [Ipomoea trifida]
MTAQIDEARRRSCVQREPFAVNSIQDLSDLHIAAPSSSTSKHHRRTIVFPTQPPPPSSASRPADVLRLTPCRRCRTSSPPVATPPTNRSSLPSPLALAAEMEHRLYFLDDLGQLYILNTGEGESQKDAKYDQERQKEMEDYNSKHKKKQNSKEEQADSENLNDYDLKNISESMQAFAKKMSSYQGAEVPESRKRCENLEKELCSLKLNLAFMNRKDYEQIKQIEELQKQNEDMSKEKERLLEEIERIISKDR